MRHQAWGKSTSRQRRKREECPGDERALPHCRNLSVWWAYEAVSQSVSSGLALFIHALLCLHPCQSATPIPFLSVCLLFLLSIPLEICFQICRGGVCWFSLRLHCVSLLQVAWGLLNAWQASLGFPLNSPSCCLISTLFSLPSYALPPL